MNDKTGEKIVRAIEKLERAIERQTKAIEKFTEPEKIHYCISRETERPFCGFTEPRGYVKDVFYKKTLDVSEVTCPKCLSALGICDSCTESLPCEKCGAGL